MSVSEKAKEKFEEANKEIKESLERLKQEVAELNRKIKEKFSGAGEGLKETAEDLNRDIKELTANVKKLLPISKKGRRLPVRVDRGSRSRSEMDIWDQPVLELQRAVNRVFDDFFRDFDRMCLSGFAGRGYGIFSPNIDVIEDDRQIEVVAELPGVDADDISVDLNGDILTIRGEKRYEKEEKGKQFYQMERTYGAFQRSFQLPCEVEENRIEARFDKGVLKIILPKSKETLRNVRKIKIKTG